VGDLLFVLAYYLFPVYFGLVARLPRWSPCWQWSSSLGGGSGAGSRPGHWSIARRCRYRALLGLTPLVEGSSRAWWRGPGDASTRASGGRLPRQGALTSRRQKCPIERWRTRSDDPITTLLMVGEDGGAHPADLSMRASVIAACRRIRQ
jgi:hypothetical protein